MLSQANVHLWPKAPTLWGKLWLCAVGTGQKLVQQKMQSLKSEYAYSLELRFNVLKGLVSRVINSLPHTLATIGESLMSQTGWNVSILMGGPTPDSDRTILTYLWVLGDDMPENKQWESNKRYSKARDVEAAVISKQKASLRRRLNLYNQVNSKGAI